jgi:hypothetical protein
LNQRRESVVYFRVRARPDNERFPAECGGGEPEVRDPQAALNALGVGQKTNNAAGRKKLRQQAEPFPGELAAHQVDARDVRARMVEARDNALAQRIAGNEGDRK